MSHLSNRKINEHIDGTHPLQSYRLEGLSQSFEISVQKAGSRAAFRVVVDSNRKLACDIICGRIDGQVNAQADGREYLVGYLPTKPEISTGHLLEHCVVCDDFHPALVASCNWMGQSTNATDQCPHSRTVFIGKWHQAFW